MKRYIIDAQTLQQPDFEFDLKVGMELFEAMEMTDITAADFDLKISGNIETNDEMFFNKIKNVFKEVLATVSLSKKEEEVELEQQEPQPEPQPTAEPQPSAEEAPKVEEPVVEEPKAEEPKPQEEPKVEQPKDNHLEELINSLKEEVETLKKMNTGLNNKVKELSKQPSAQPVNTNAKPSNGDTYSAWREQMRSMIG